MSQGDRKKLDPRTLLALSQMRKPDHSNRVTGYLIAAAVLVLAFGGIAWWVGRDLEPESLALAAYDDVALPDTEVTLRAWLQAPGQDDVKLGGRELLFQVAVTQTGERAASDDAGTASVSWHAPKATQPVEFLVRFSDKKLKLNLRDSGRVFVWPATAELLVVDADHALTDFGAAADALKPLGARYKIVYLTADADRPTDYHKLRASLRQGGRSSRPNPLPDGPLLGPTVPLGQGDLDIAAIGQVDRLKQTFPGKAVGVAGRPTEAQMFLTAGWTTFLIGDAADAPAGATVLASWDELPKQLAGAARR